MELLKFSSGIKIKINYFRCFLVLLFHSCIKEPRAQFEAEIFLKFNGELL